MLDLFKCQRGEYSIFVQQFISDISSLFMKFKAMNLYTYNNVY